MSQEKLDKVIEEVTRRMEEGEIDAIDAEVLSTVVDNMASDIIKETGATMEEFRKLAGIDVDNRFRSIIPSMMSMEPIPPSTKSTFRFKAYRNSGKDKIVSYGHSVIADIDVNNPTAGYREPAKVSALTLLTEAALDFKHLVEIHSTDGQSFTASQRELVKRLNAEQNQVTFVLREPRTWRKRLRALFGRREKIRSKPCGCYPCDCQMFCIKDSPK